MAGTWSLYSNDGSTLIGTYTGDNIHTVTVVSTGVIDNKGNKVTYTPSSGTYFVGVSLNSGFNYPMLTMNQSIGVSDGSYYPNCKLYVVTSTFPFDAPREHINLKAGSTTLFTQHMSARNTPLYYKGASIGAIAPGKTATINTTDKYCKGNIQAGTVVYATADKFVNTNLVVQKTQDAYDYGTGSLNIISGGYNGKIRVAGVPNHSVRKDIARAGNFYGELKYPLATVVSDNGSSFTSSSNYMLYNGVYYWNTDESGNPVDNYQFTTNTFTHTGYNGSYVFNYWFHGGTFMATWSVNSFKLTIDGADYSLAEAVSNGLIRPIVLTQSYNDGGNNYTTSGAWAPQQQYCAGALNIYNNTSPGTRLYTPYDQVYSGLGSLDSTYGQLNIWITTIPGHTLSGCKVTANWHVFQATEQYAANDGLTISCCPEADMRITMDNL